MSIALAGAFAVFLATGLANVVNNATFTTLTFLAGTLVLAVTLTPAFVMARPGDRWANRLLGAVSVLAAIAGNGYILFVAS